MDDAIRREDAFTAAFPDGVGDPFRWMLRQQLQHANELTGTCQTAVTRLQMSAEVGEFGRQLPVAIHVRVVQTARFSR